MRFYKEDGIRRQHYDDLITKAMGKINNLQDPALQTIVLQISKLHSFKFNSRV